MMKMLFSVFIILEDDSIDETGASDWSNTPRIYRDGFLMMGKN